MNKSEISMKYQKKQVFIGELNILNVDPLPTVCVGQSTKKRPSSIRNMFYVLKLNSLSLFYRRAEMK